MVPSRKAIYILLTKAGPSQETQMGFIQQQVKIDPAHDQVYVDDVTDRRRTRDALFPDRDNMLKQLRAGDAVVVATPGRLGIGREGVRTVLHELHRRNVPLIDASTGRSIVWTDEIADALRFFDRAALEHKQDAAKAARGARLNMGIPVAPVNKSKELKVPPDEARAMWLDQVRYPSGIKVAALCGVTQRTMYNRFGKRAVEPTPKKLTPSMRTPDGRNYVYVMLRRDGCHKIGFSIDPLARRQSLQFRIGQPVRLVHHVLRPGDACAVEHTAHRYLHKKRRDGEWFASTLEEARAAINQACRDLDVTNLQKWRRTVVEAAEKEAGRQFTRREITDLLASMEARDETEVT